MTTQAMFLILAGAAVILTIVSAVRDKQRTKRRNLDKPGWMPWDVLQILAGIVAVVAIVLALKAG
jgi:hypothetical protein